MRSPTRTSLYNKHGGRLSFAGKQFRSSLYQNANANMHGKSCSYFEQVDTEDISLESQKTWNHTAGARRCRCRGEASDLLSLPRSQPRGPPYEDWFHETPRARPARLLRTRQREREIHRKSVFDGKAGGGGRRGACRERTRGVWVPFFERGLLHRARGSTVT